MEHLTLKKQGKKKFYKKGDKLFEIYDEKNKNYELFIQLVKTHKKIKPVTCFEFKENIYMIDSVKFGYNYSYNEPVSFYISGIYLRELKTIDTWFEKEAMEWSKRNLERAYNLLEKETNKK